MTDTQSPQPEPQPESQPQENIELLALRHALEEAGTAVNRSETLLNSARSDLQNEKRNAAKLRVELESEKARAISLKSQLEQAKSAELVLGEPVTADATDSPDDEVTILKKEQTRLKLLVLELSKERDELRSRLAEASASARSGGSSADFIGAAGPETAAMAVEMKIDASEPPPLRLKP